MTTHANHLLRGVWVVLVLGWACWSQAASPPERINFQGVLRDSAGAPIDPSASMMFRLYDSGGGGCPASGGTLLLTDDQGTVPVSGGLFNVALGGGTMTPGKASGLGEVFRAHAAVWVEIVVGGETLCPRVRVESSAYAQNALHLEGKRAGEFLDTSSTAQTKSAPLRLLTDVDHALEVRAESTSGQTTRVVVQGARSGGGSASSLDLVNYDGDEPAGMEEFIMARIAGGALADGNRGQLQVSVNDGTGLQETVRIASNGDVGIGTTTPSARLDVAGTTELNGDVTVTQGNNLTVGGTIESTSGGIKFPDGSVQTSAVRQLPPDTCFDNVGRYAVCGDGTVKDNLTDLFWLEDADCSGALNWANAGIAAAQLADGQCGLTDGSSAGDWRLPTKDEWQVIVDQAVANGCGAPYVPDVVGTGCCGTETCAFSGVQSFYWSATTSPSIPSQAFLANLGVGTVGTGATKTIANFVWPVRGGR